MQLINLTDYAAWIYRCWPRKRLGLFPPARGQVTQVESSQRIGKQVAVPMLQSPGMTFRPEGPTGSLREGVPDGRTAATSRTICDRIAVSMTVSCMWSFTNTCRRRSPRRPL